MSQRRYRDNLRAFSPGMDLVEDFGKKRTIVNKHPQQKQVEEISITGDPGADKKYEVKIDGFVSSYTTPSSGHDEDDLVNGLKDAINANKNINGTVKAEADTAADKVTVTERFEGGGGFTIAEESDPGSNLSISQTSASKTADPIPWGRLVTDHGTLGKKLGRLADASNLTKRHLRLSVSSAQNSTEYRVLVKIAGEVFEATFTSDADATVDEVVNGLQSAIDGLSNLVDATADTSGDNVDIKAETAGFYDFDVIFYTPTADLTLSEVADGDDINELAAGVAMVGGDRTVDPDTDVGQWKANSEVDIKEDGAWVAVEAEEKPSQGDTVYVRLSANGNNDKLGAFRASWDSGAVPLKGAKFVNAVDSNVAAIEVP